MARRKQFKGIAKNLAQWCLSRNNDYSGYWVVGQLYKYSREQNENIISVNVLNSNFTHEGEFFSTLCNSLTKIAKHQMYKNSIPESWLKSISVKFHFEAPYEHKYHCWGSALGKPMLCSISIVTDLGREYTGESGCNCWVHNPIKESRRYGF
jgi:hypothetical protein